MKIRVAPRNFPWMRLQLIPLSFIVPAYVLTTWAICTMQIPFRHGIFACHMHTLYTSVNGFGTSAIPPYDRWRIEACKKSKRPDDYKRGFTAGERLEKLKRPTDQHQPKVVGRVEDGWENSVLQTRSGCFWTGSPSDEIIQGRRRRTYI